MNIQWSPVARLDYIQNITYLEEHWSEREIIVFNQSIEHHLNLLSSGTISFTKTNYKDVFKVVLIKQITLFYVVDENDITLLRFWNNYQDLSKFRLK